MKNFFFSLVLIISGFIATAQTNFTDTKGELSITSSGQASYNLPIALPPSLKNVAPVINLTYSSGQRGGIAGQGWSLAGISSICRTATRVDIDGFRDGVDFDDNDKLSLDGQRLLLKTGTYWADGSTYETEYKSNTKIELKIENIAGNPTQIYFIITNPDGSQAWYGGLGDGYYRNSATSINAWYILKFIDAYSNFIVYSYTPYTYNGTTQNYIENIYFSGNNSLNNYLLYTNQIKFNYRSTNASRVEMDYMKGQAVYAFKVLDNIQVLTGGEQFRKYKISQVADDAGYERVSQVQEFNGVNEGANPVVFSYNTASSNAAIAGESAFDSNFGIPTVSLSGDFNGDGQQDFMTNNQLYTGLLNGGSGNASIGLPFTADKNIFSIKTLIGNKYVQQDNILKIENNSNIPTENSFSFKVYNFESSANNFINVYNKIINLTPKTIINLEEGIDKHPYNFNCGDLYYCTNIGRPAYASLKQSSFEIGDFDGDGISEVFIKKKETETYTRHYENVYDKNNHYCGQYCSITLEPVNTYKFYIADLNPNKPASATEIYDPNNYLNINNADWQRYEIYDANGDGKSDLIVIGNGYEIYNFKQLSQAPWIELEKIGQGVINSSYVNEKFFGDYNGDGKVDFMMPKADNSDWWSIFYANPKINGDNFYDEVSYQLPLLYQPFEKGNTFEDYRSYHTMDINNDGKTDIVSIKRAHYKVQWTLSDFDTDYEIKAFTNNIGVANTNFTETYSVFEKDKSEYMATPFVGNFNLNNNSAQIIMWQHDDVFQAHTYNFTKDIVKDNLLKTVSESNGTILQTVDYSSMVNDGSGIYATDIEPNYPLVCIKRNLYSYLVSKLTASINGVNKFQDFKYRSMISNFEYGTIGFARTARSSWYTSMLPDKIWTVQEIDPNKRGASTNTWSTTNGANVFATIPFNLISTKTNEFETYTNPTTKVYNVQLKKQTTTDHLTTVKNETNFTYDEPVNGTTGFGLQTKTVNNTYLGTVLQGTSTVETTFENNAGGTGNAYFIGKPKTVSSSKTIYPDDASKTDTRTSKELYTYTGANLTKIEKKGHLTTNSVFEDMTYDNFGNLLTKTISCPGASPALASRTITDEYDPATKRFVIKKTDHQGFQTLLQYNNLGQVTKSTNYMGVVSDFAFDNWGKLTTSITTGASITALINTTAYAKLTNGGYTTTNTNNTDAAVNTTQYDVLGRVVKSTTKGFAPGTTISKSVVYDALGRKTKEYEPYFTSPGKFTAYTYDYLQRPLTVTAPTGRLQTISYNGLTTTSLDDTKTTSATADALGNKVTTTDEGGTINFKYYANGQLKESDYGGHKITVAIDGWGNKTSMTDPNAGTYTYTTDEFGQAKTETTPKGKTTYTYDNVGKLITKTILGDGADYVTTYAYNSFAQLISETSKKANNTAIDVFEYRYDNLKRLDKTSETNPTFTHSKTITFDNYSRPTTETTLTTDTVSGLSATVVAKSNYNVYNGMMDKMTDANNAVLWQLNTANEKMQALTATLGNGIAVTNTYDSDNYFTSQRHKKGTTDVVYNTYNFNAIKGNLNNRQNVPLSTNEFFTFDNLDRLTAWSNPATNIVDVQSYDERGRIDSNDVGAYKYTNAAAAGLYRKTSINLSADAKTYYTAKPSQTATYTMFKSPMTINESSLGATRFNYNSHLSRTRMYYGWATSVLAAPTVRVGGVPTNNTILSPLVAIASVPQPSGNYTKLKLYTDDGSTEIFREDGKIRIITYIGGTAYSAPLYNEKVKTTSGGAITDNNYYLHRDYLGSIIAISNSAGVAIERRHFDAWGNLSKLEKNGVAIAMPTTNGGLEALMVLDRGYTSHEHLAEVGLIQMNGRLYDPKLHTFLMPDNFVQQPENTQSYNRYGYCINNPLKYTDPSGELFGLDDLAAAIIIGAFISASTYTITCLTSGQSFSWQGLATATFIGAASAAVTFGIGSGANSMFTSMQSATWQQVARGAMQALMHGAFQGTMAAIQGGNFWNGAAAGALSSIASSAFGFDGNGKDTAGLGWADSVRGHGAGMIAFGTVAGGVGAELSGGNFWQGAAIGLIVSGLNHAMHQMDSEDDNGYDKNGKQINNNGGDKTDTMYNDDGSVFSTTKVSEGGGRFADRGYGFKTNQLASGACADDSLNFTSNVFAVGEIYKGAKLLYMGLTTVSKASLGFKVLGGASSGTLKSSVYYKAIYGSKQFIWKGQTTLLPTLFGPSTTYLSSFYGRNAALFGIGRIGVGGTVLSH